MENTKINYDFIGLGIEFNLYSLIYGYYGLAVAYLGQVQDGIALCEKGLGIAKESNSIMGISLLEYTLGWIYVEKGDAENAIDKLESSLNYCEEANYTVFLGLLWSSLGHAYLQKGNSDTAIRFINKGLKLQMNTGRQGLLSWIYYCLGCALLATNKLKEAQQAIEKGLESARKNNEIFNESLLMITNGIVLRKKEPTKWIEAGEIIQKEIKILEKLEAKLLYSRGYLFLGELYYDSGKREKALEYLIKAEENFKEMGMDYWLKKTQDILGEL